MANASIEIEIRALDRASRSLENIERSLNPLRNKVNRIDDAFDNVDRSVRQVESSSGRLRGAFTALAGAAAAVGLGSMARDAIDTFTGYERLQVQLQTYLGSQEAANSEMARLQELANSLPQDLADITGAFVTLTRVGVDTSNDSITALSNVATANAKSFDQLAEALADSLTGEFERLKEFGVKVSKENDQFVADFGNGNTQVFNSAQEVTEAVIALGREGGRFGDAAAINAGTLSQSFSNLKGAVYEAQVAFGEGAKGGMKEFTEAITVLVRDNKDLIGSLGEGLGNVLAALPDAFIAVKGVMEDLEPVFSLLSTIATEIVVPLGKLAFETLVALAEAIGPLAEEWIPILKDAFVEIANIIATVVTAAFEGIKVTIQGVMDFINGAVETARQAWEFVSGIAGSVSDAASAVGNKASEMGGAVLDTASDLGRGAIETGRDWYNGVTGWFSDTEEEVVGNSIVPDMVNAVGDWMDMLPNKMALPAQFAADGVVDAMNRMSQSIMNMSAISSQSGFTSPVSGIGGSAGPVNSNVNFHISGVNLNNDRITPDMKQYVEGVAIKVANQVLRQQTNFGGLI
jgi:predicted  nucleic acid-binding Zn-ribbon protein